MTLHEARQAMERFAMFVAENHEAPQMEGLDEMVAHWHRDIMTRIMMNEMKVTVLHHQTSIQDFFRPSH